MPRGRRPAFTEAEHLDLMVEAARLSLRITQIAVGKELGLSASTTNRLLSEVEEHGILKTVVRLPRDGSLENTLLDYLSPKSVRRAVVAVCPANDIHMLAHHAATEVFRSIIIASGRKDPKESIRIVISGGPLVAATMTELLDVMENRIRDNLAVIKQKLDFWPSVAVPAFDMIPEDPSTIAAEMVGATLGYDSWIKNITGRSLKLPPGFPEASPDVKALYMNASPYNALAEEYKNADIFVLGASRCMTSFNSEIHERLGIREQVNALGQSDTPQLSYIPIGEDGKGDPEISQAIVGLKIEGIQEAFRMGKEVIVIGGGPDAEAMQRLIEHPCYSSIVTDHNTAQMFQRNRGLARSHYRM